MSQELIFITGASGFIGSATALATLKAGYRLRICLRKPSEQLETVLSAYSKQIEFVIVPDITDEAAFDGKLHDVDYVFHLASPLLHGTNKETYFKPAVEGTTALLKAAAKVPSIKKVVVTSSIAALIPLTGLPDGGVIKEDNDWDFSVDENGSFEDPENPAGPRCDSTWDFWTSTKPHYALVTLHPAFVYGHNLVQTSADGVYSGSNANLWGLIMKDRPTSLTGVHIQDVADAHVKTLNPKIADGSKYLLVGPKTSGAEIASIVHKNYPDSGALINENSAGSVWPTDTTKAETELGIQWRSYEAIVKELMDQQLAFL